MPDSGNANSEIDHRLPSLDEESSLFLDMLAESDTVAAIADVLRDGDHPGDGTLNGLAESLYRDLHQMAHRELRRLRPGQTLNTTSLVNECYLKMARCTSNVVDRTHFLAVCAIAMRHVLVNAARAKLVAKRGAGGVPETLDEGAVLTEWTHAEEVIAVNDALDKLREVDSRLGSVVECRFFAGLTEEETGLALGVSYRTVRRDWQRARAWLRHELGRAEPPTLEASEPL